MEKKCPRCGSHFDCKKDDISKCRCFHVPISPEGHQHIKGKYNDCLCMNCLKEIGQKSYSLPK